MNPRCAAQPVTLHILKALALMLVRLLVLVLVVMGIAKLVFANVLAMLALLTVMVLPCTKSEADQCQLYLSHIQLVSQKVWQVMPLHNNAVTHKNVCSRSI